MVFPLSRRNNADLFTYDTKQAMVEALTKLILDQAKYFLSDAGEFYPFGSYIETNHTFRPVSLFSECDNPNSVEILEQLENILKAGVEKKEYLMAAIGIDIFVNINSSQGVAKKSAVEIRIYEENKYSTVYFLYHLKNNDYYFEFFNLKE